MDPPDIDVDFAWDERDGILNWVLSEFKGHAAMVSSHILFQPRMAVREVAKVYGLPEQEIKSVSRRMSGFWQLNEAAPAHGPARGLLERIQKKPEFKGMDFPHPWPEIMTRAQALINTPRYLSVHPGGIVITPDPIDTYVPVETAPKGIPLIQWEKEGAEAAGLVKIDLLGNRSLGVIRDCIHTIESAIGGFADYLKRLHTWEWEPIHPILEGVLEETFGIMVFQEDVSRVAVHLAGFSHAKADGLRKIMSKKDKTRELVYFYTRFVEGAAARGVAKADIQRVWDMILSFSGYSFCKPHSASYARVSFQAAYLKTHYPAEFMAAVISNQGGFYSTFAYVSEARRMGVKIFGPDILESQIRWTGKSFQLRVGFMAIKHLTAATMARIMAERNCSLFTGLENFLNRVSPREDEVLSLVHSGCLDRFRKNETRSGLVWAFLAWQKDRNRHNQAPTLFGGSQNPIPIPQLPLDHPRERLRREFSVLGFLCDCHPIVLFSSAIQRENTLKAIDLPQYVGKRVGFAGWLITGKVVNTKQGDPMKFLTFEDETGIIETVFFSGVYARFCHCLDYGKPYFLFGKIESDWGAITLTVETTRQIHH